MEEGWGKTRAEDRDQLKGASIKVPAGNPLAHTNGLTEDILKKGLFAECEQR